MGVKINEKFLKEKNMDQYLDVFEYLEELRQSGETNMFGAISYILREFPDLDRQTAKEILKFYMQNYLDIYEF